MYSNYNPKPAEDWISDAIKGASVPSVKDVKPQSFIRNRAMTRDAMAQLLSRVCGIVSSQLQTIRDLEDSLKDFDYTTMELIEREQKANQSVEEQKAASALEVVDLQREVLNLQRELLVAKDEQLDALKDSVTASVRKTVETEFKSYSSVVRGDSGTKSPESKQALKTI